MASPAGDQIGAKDLSSFVTRSSSVPRTPSRMTMSVPNESVFVAAMYFVSGDHAGAR